MATLVHVPLSVGSVGGWSTLKVYEKSCARRKLQLAEAHVASGIQKATVWQSSSSAFRSSPLPKHSRRRSLVKAAAADEVASDSVTTKEKGSSEVLEKSLSILKEAATTKKVPKKDVLAAILSISKEKGTSDGLLANLGGTKSPGREWELVFTSSTKQVTDARKGGEGGGTYFPLTAVQNFDAEALKISNGVYFGDFGALVFRGRFAFKGRTLAFMFDTVEVKLGPLGPISFNTSSDDDKKRTAEVKRDPFFNFFYASDELLIGQGRSGGMAFWKRRA